MASSGKLKKEFDGTFSTGFARPSLCVRFGVWTSARSGSSERGSGSVRVGSRAGFACAGPGRLALALGGAGVACSGSGGADLAPSGAAGLPQARDFDLQSRRSAWLSPQAWLPQWSRRVSCPSIRRNCQSPRRPFQRICQPYLGHLCGTRRHFRRLSAHIALHSERQFSR